MPVDMSTLPITGGLVLALAAGAAISAFALGPLVAKRTIEVSGWQEICTSELTEATNRRQSTPVKRPEISCDDLAKGVGGMFGLDARQFCDGGGDMFFELLSIDPLAQEKERARQHEQQRLSKIARLAPTRCSCAARTVASDRVTWGLYAGTARLLGGPDNLQADLVQALHAPACALRVEG